MNGSNNNNLFLEDQVKANLREYNPAKLTEMVEEEKKLGYNSFIEYLINAHELYRGLTEENRKGKLIIVLSHNPSPMRKDNGKVCINLDEQDRIINLKIKGLEYKTANGNGYPK